MLVFLKKKKSLRVILNIFILKTFIKKLPKILKTIPRATAFERFHGKPQAGASLPQNPHANLLPLPTKHLRSRQF